MEKNNGKIAIAIVAMFVVALSVVGFTYAYFTAQVQGNTADKSVEVTAGKLAIVYANGNEILAQNLVPGWVSDDAHFYDSQYSLAVDASGNYLTDADGNYKIVAVNTADCAKKSDGQNPGTADGKVGPVTFSVSNATDNTGDNAYIIRLKDISNGLAEADRVNFFVTLYNTDTNTVVWSGNLLSTSPQVIVSEPLTIAKTYTDSTLTANAQDYKIVATYKNIDGAQSSKGVSVKATVEIVGVVKATAASEGIQVGDWIDADGVKVNFPAANVQVPDNGIDTTYNFKCDNQ